ncbi:hypothetical protein GCM10010399_80870 [Dactylosporangium fulvum]|uniref:DUF3043 domain-containing protein n=1 Tax=Dactylosporangium fulvum TaxID=53359 RepID=A0ABY5VXH4_9ACTN|nr:DUF3043 domain-containing protein [Dactylosporangium fulvum]UWP81178.1 DUF3043 domain-containing protein [Dactylosporangium fulvum]
MPSLFRRKSEDPDTVAVPDVEDTEPDAASKGHTPSKRELGKVTPKRIVAGRRVVEPPAANRREAAKRMRERMRAERVEAREGMANGDERYLLPRDKGPVRRLVRDIVDSRRTIGTWFFGTTFLVMLVGFNRNLNPSIYFAANALFGVMFIATAIDSLLISRTVKRLVKERFPDTNEKLGRLYFYAIMRAISFRFIRNPKPQVKVGAAI